MIIDIDEVPEIKKGKIPNKLLAELIDEHQKTLSKYNKLDKYFFNDESIVEKQRLLKDSLNNIIIASYPRYITILNSGCFMSSEINYNVNEEIDIEPVLNEYKKQTILKTDKSNVRKESKYGRCYELTYANNNSEPKTKSISPKNAFVVKSNNLDEKELFGVYYFETNGIYTIYTFTDKYINYGTCKSLSLQQYNPKKEKHYFGEVPLIEVMNNEECIGDYESVISLINAYNIITSNDVDNIEEFVDAILLLFGANLDYEQKKLLKETRGLELPENAKAEYLTKVLDEVGINAALDRLRKDIHKFSFTPDMGDENFAGNSSGVALDYKLLPFIISLKDKEAFYKETLKKRFKLYNNFLSVKQNMPIIPIEEIEIKMTLTFPKNDLEIAQMISYLSGNVTNQTLISNLSFIEDAIEEDELVKTENQEKMKQSQLAMYSSGGFDDNHNNEDSTNE